MAKKRGPRYEPDPFQSTLRGPLEWASKHVSVFVIFVVTVFLVLTGLVFIFRATAARADRGWEALASVSGADATLEVAKRHAGTPAEPFALHRAGCMLLQAATGREKSDPEREEELKRAEDALARVVEEFGDDFIALYSRQALGLVHEESGRYALAAEQFRAALDQAPNSYLKPKLQYDLGRSLVLDGRPDEARSYLEQAAYTRERWGLPDYIDDYSWRKNAKYLLITLSPGRRIAAPPAPSAPGGEAGEGAGGETPKKADDVPGDEEPKKADAPEKDAPKGDAPEKGSPGGGADKKDAGAEG